LDLDRLPGLAERVRESDTTVVPTIQHFWSIKFQSADEAAWLQRPEMELLPRVTQDSWRGQRHYSRMFSEPFHLRRIDACARAQMGLIKTFYESGIPLVAGTDALAWGSVPGTSLHDELAYYVEAGLPIDAAIATATVNSERLFKIPGMGRIAPEAPADLVLLNADPCDSIANLRDIAGVMANGRWHTRAELWELHDKALASAGRTR
jgi:hypothetical protein